MDFIFRAAERFLKKHKRMMRYRRIFATLAAVVVFATTYELILPAITMDSYRAANSPGMKVGIYSENPEVTRETDDFVNNESSGNSAAEVVASDALESGDTGGNTFEFGDDISDTFGAEDNATDVVDGNPVTGGTAESGSLPETQDSNATEDVFTNEPSRDEGVDAGEDFFSETGTSDGETVHESGLPGVNTGTDRSGNEAYGTDDALNSAADGGSTNRDAATGETENADGSAQINQGEETTDETVGEIAGEGGDVVSGSAADGDRSGEFSAEAAAAASLSVEGADTESAENLSANNSGEEAAEAGGTETADTAGTSEGEAAAEASLAAGSGEDVLTKFFDGGDYTITAEYDETAAFPAGVILNAVEILPEITYRDENETPLYAGYDEYYEKTVDTLEKAGSLGESHISGARFFDISFTDAAGRPVEPAAPVTIAVRYKDTPDTGGSSRALAVHFDDVDVEDREDEEKPEIGKAEVIETSEQTDESETKEISFAAGKFSVYAIVITKDGVSVAEGENSVTIQGTANNTHKNTPDDAWESSAESVVTVTRGNNNTATVTAVSAGEAVITHTYYPTKSGNSFPAATETFDVVVSETGAISVGSSITLNPASVNVEIAGTEEVSVTTAGADPASVTVSSSDETIASASYSEGVITVTGIAEGTAEITVSASALDGYTAPADAVISVTVSAPSYPEYERTNTENEGLTVTVKETGQVKKALTAYKLAVKPVAETDNAYEALETAVETDTGDSEFDFLKMYHVYFAQKDDETDTEVPYSEVLSELGIKNMNLQVTISYENAPEGWPEAGKNIKVCHYKVTDSTAADNPSVTNEGVSDEENGTESKVQSIKVSGNSVTFHLKSFSTISLSSSGNTGSNVNVNTDPGNATFTQADDYKTWQIVNQGGMNAYNYVRVHKTVTENEAENSFSVKLWIDLKQQSLVQQIISNAGFAYTTNTYTVGEEVPYTQGWHSHLSAAVDLYNTNNADFFCDEPMAAGSVSQGVPKKDHDVKYLIVIRNSTTGEEYTVTKYGWQANFNNGQLYMRTTNGGTATEGTGNDPTNTDDDVWICIGDLAKENGTVTDYVLTAEMTQQQIETMISNSLNSEIGSVIDTMGSNITLDRSSVTADGTVAVNGNTITWNPVILTRLTEGSGDDAGWYTNVAQMTYDVTLTPSVSTGLTTDEALPDKDLNDSATAGVNSSATYSYTVVDNNVETDATAVFPKPYVRGMLYEIKVKKVDASDETKGLSGAVFTLYSDPDCSEEHIAAVSPETDGNGYTSFTGLFCGTYYLKETTAPEGYEISDSSVRTITVGYFDNSAGDTNSDENAKAPTADTLESMNLEGQGAHKALLSNQTSSPFADLSEGIDVRIKKQGVDGPGTVVKAALGGAKFTVYENDGTTVAKDKSGTSLANLESNADTGIVFSGKLMPGTYIVKETESPAGYTKSEDYTIVVSGGSSPTVTAQTGSEAAQNLSKSDDGFFELTISNVLSSIPVKIVKIGNADTQNTLQGVAFSVSGPEGFTQTTWTSDDTGILYEGDLPAGDYTLTETDTPEGYNSLTNPVTVTIAPSGINLDSSGYYPVSVMQTDYHGGETQYPLPDQDTNKYVIYINNNPGAVLPETGGTGFISPQVLGGIMAMSFSLAAAVMYGFSMRRGERRYR